MAPEDVPPEEVPPDEVPLPEEVPLPDEVLLELVELPPSVSFDVVLVTVHALMTATPSAEPAMRVAIVNLALEFISRPPWATTLTSLSNQKSTLGFAARSGAGRQVGCRGLSG